MALTNDHGGELEALAYAFPVDLVGKVGETDETHELFPDDWRKAVLVFGDRLWGDGGAVIPGREGDGRVTVGRVVVGHGWV